MERTQKALADKIRAWEYRAGESFTDYYMHDNVKDVSWAFWLLGKGYSERANILIDLIQSGEKCIDQQLLYELHTDPEQVDLGTDYQDHLYRKDILLWAEFLVASDRYWKSISEWFAEQDELHK